MSALAFSLMFYVEAYETAVDRHDRGQCYWKAREIAAYLIKEGCGVAA